MSLYDFYMYLRFIELSPENLEFYVWCVLGPQRRTGSRVPWPRQHA
jgi:hypothetical protein